MSYFFYYHYNYWNNYENVIVFLDSDGKSGE